LPFSARPRQNRDKSREEKAMFGLMQDRPLMISSIITHAARQHSKGEVVSKTIEGTIHRTNYAEVERRSRRLARALIRLGIKADDRVATLALNSFRHLELYYAISGMGAICHTINPRLALDDIAYIIDHAGDRIVCVDNVFAPIMAAVASKLRAPLIAIIVMAERAHMPAVQLPAGTELLCYEEVMAASDETYVWPEFDERTAASLCYTSGTTGRPKGVLYSHRSTLLHALAVNVGDVIGIRATDRILPVVPMFHVNAWGIPYSAPMAGAAIIMPGRHLDGASLAGLLNDEHVTISCGVPTVWLGLLQHLRASGQRIDSVRRLTVGGSAVPRSMTEAFGSEYGVDLGQGWGMTEMSPVGTYCQPNAANAHLAGEDLLRLKEKQGRALWGVEMRILGEDSKPLPWDGKAFGLLQVRGPWVCSAYFGDAPNSALDAEGWFSTGDIATIDQDGFMEITDRAKDVIKSGGEWISSVQLENIAVGHPDVAEAAIIAARHEKWDERPLLFVVAKPDRTIDKDSVMSVFSDKIAKWWLPDDVVVVDELPHTATGKVHKMVLREKYRDYLVDKG